MLQTNSYLYESICERLESHIRDGRLEPGLVLLENPLAEAFQTSRAPVQRALAELEAKGLVTRFNGRGFLVGNGMAPPAPVRRALKPLIAELNEVSEDALPSRWSWERIYTEVERAVASSLVFGCYRIFEAELADHFAVSRTVARDVLGRLQHSGLVRKSASSHWLAGPLTAKEIRDGYEIRVALEPLALRRSAATMDRETLQQLRADCELPIEGDSEAVQTRIERLEQALHVRTAERADNEQLAETLRRVQLPAMQAERFLRSLGMPVDTQLPAEHRIVYELLLSGSVDAACAALVAHLHAEARRSITHLKTAAVISEPEHLAPYLTRWTG